jgi:hypothetical protein
MRAEETNTLWADRENIPSSAPVADAWCDECGDTAALYVERCWRCGSCGSELVQIATSLIKGWVRRVDAQNVAINAKCYNCGKPATCYGAYEDTNEHFACNDCCGHGNEDGWCDPVEKS